MAMDKVIHQHLDNRLDMQDEVVEGMDKLYGQLNIDRILRNPDIELKKFAQGAAGVVQGLSKKAVKEGVRFAKEVKAEKPIGYPDTKDPNLNKDMKDAPSFSESSRS